MFVRLIRSGVVANAHGNVTIIFGLMIVPFVSFAGLSIDYSKAVRVESSIQATLDAAAITASRVFQTSGSTSDAVAAASKYVASRRASHPEFELTTSDVDPQAGTVNLAGTSMVSTAFMGILGSRFDTITVNASATASLAQGRSGGGAEVQKKLRTIMARGMAGSTRGNQRREMQKAAEDLAERILSDHGGTLNRSRLGHVTFDNALRAQRFALPKILENASNGNVNGRALRRALRKIGPGVTETRLTK